jgi:hypothetical protein
MKKLIKMFLRLFIPLHLRKKIRALLEMPGQINELKGQNNSLSYELWKMKTLLLLKEQSPQLLQKFASGLVNDAALIDLLAKTNIFLDIQDEFRANMNQFLGKFGGGGEGLTPQKIHDNQMSLAENSLYKKQVFTNMISVFMPYYADDNLANDFENLYTDFVFDDPWCNIVYMSWLLLRKEEEKALDILRRHLKAYAQETIIERLPVADLAHRNGISNENIAAASGLFQTIRENFGNNLLEKYVDQFGDNVKIAIVGNGPHELGRGRGAEIDGHDIVVRFNDYNDSEKFACDYGKKANIVIFSTAWPQLSLILNKQVPIFLTYDLYNENYSLDLIGRYKEKPFSNITTIGLSPVKKEIREKYNIGWPTSGFTGIYYFKEYLKKNIKKSDIYGFSLNSEKLIQEGHYENPDPNDESGVRYKLHHDFNLEWKMLKEMFNKGNS